MRRPACPGSYRQLGHLELLLRLQSAGVQATVRSNCQRASACCVSWLAMSVVIGIDIRLLNGDLDFELRGIELGEQLALFPRIEL